MKSIEKSIITFQMTREEGGDLLSFLDHLESGSVFNSKAAYDFYNELCKHLKETKTYPAQ